jgi:hypothetical protein
MAKFGFVKEESDTHFQIEIAHTLKKSIQSAIDTRNSPIQMVK